MINQDPIGVWIDTKKAYVIRMKGDDCEVNRIESQVERRHRSTGGLASRLPWWGRSMSSTDKDDARRTHQFQDFFEEIDQATKDCKHLFIFGPGNVKKKLKTYFETHANDERRFSNVETTTSRITEREIVAFVRNRFGKSLPRSGVTQSTQQTPPVN